MIPVNTPILDGNEKKYLIECIDTGWISSEGPFVDRFETDLARYVGRKHGVSCCNGSAALDMAVQALDIGPGDEVLMPTFTIISPAASVVRQGAKPVLVDSDPHTWQMNVSQLESKITERTKAIIAVHIYGFPADMDPLMKLANAHSLRVIEDAAEMHGQTYNGRQCGSFGDISTFSFYPNKHVTTGEGGMTLTDDDELAERLRSLRNLCFLPNRRFVHEEIGWNYRMTNLQAALGVAQMEQLNEIVLRKRALGRRYNELLRDCPYIEFPPESLDYADNIYWIYGLILKDDYPGDAQWVMKQLSAEKIGTRPFFFPMHQQPVFKKMGWFVGESYPVAERMSERGFYIPCGLGITDKQQQAVACALAKILENGADDESSLL